MARTTITVYPDGPLVLRGPAALLDEEGRPVQRRRRTVALCRCGRSGITPFCDGSHKAGGRSRGGSRAMTPVTTTIPEEGP
ncbi:MAG: CDGSH iron-sulfur domain-containing protein [Actinomycetes bacterium]